MVVLAGLGYALAGFIVKRRFKGVQPIGLVTGTTLSASLLLLPFAIATSPGGTPQAGPIAAVVVLGVGGTGIAFLIYYTLLSTAGPAKASLVAYVAPGFSVVYGVVFLSESFTISTFVGLVLILVGSWLAAGGRLPRRTEAGAEATAATSP